MVGHHGRPPHTDGEIAVTTTRANHVADVARTTSGATTLERAPHGFPLRPSGRRGRGPARSAGRVRWALSASALESPTSPQPSPPPRAERESGTAQDEVFRTKA